MSEIFLSYKSEDRAKAQIIAEALEKKKFSVWWDPIIPPGKKFEDVIEEELNAASCVVVLWSEKSVNSKWIRTEVAEGNSREILIPVLIEDVIPPLFYKQIEAAKLIDWDGKLPNPEFDLLLESVSRILGKVPALEKKQDNKIIENLNTSAKQFFDVDNFSEAITKWKEVLTIDAGNKQATAGIKSAENKKIENLNTSAKQLFDDEKFSEAIAKWKDVLQLDTENNAAKDGIKRAYEEINKQLSDSIGELEKVRRLNAESLKKKYDEKIQNLNRFAQQLYNEGNYPEAIAKWKEVRTIDAENEQAITGINNAKEEIKRRISDLSISARVLFNKNEYHDAIKKWNDILKFDPENNEAKDEIKKANKILITELISSAENHYNNESYSKAKKKWTEILGIDPENKTAKDGIDKWLYDLIDSYSRVLEINPEDINVKNELKRRHVELRNNLDFSAQRLSDEGNYPEAIAKWKEVLKFDPENNTAADRISEAQSKITNKISDFNTTAHRLSAAGDYSQAIETWKKVLILESNNDTAKDGIKRAEEEIKRGKEEIPEIPSDYTSA